MCLVINHRNLKTAAKDIVVYKMLLKTKSGELFAPFRVNFKYEQNKLIFDLQEADIKKDDKGNRIVGKGFIHAFRTIAKAKEGVEDYLSRYKKRTEINGLTLCVYRAVIPKGTKFYEGKEWNICSKSIMILEEITE